MNWHDIGKISDAVYRHGWRNGDKETKRMPNNFRYSELRTPGNSKWMARLFDDLSRLHRDVSLNRRVGGSIWFGIATGPAKSV